MKHGNERQSHNIGRQVLAPQQTVYDRWIVAVQFSRVERVATSMPPRQKRVIVHERLAWIVDRVVATLAPERVEPRVVVSGGCEHIVASSVLRNDAVVLTTGPGRIDVLPSVE